MDVIKNLLIFSVVYFSLSSSSLLIAEKTDKKMSKKTSKKKKETKKTDVKKEKNTKDIKSAEASSPTAQKPLEKQNQIATVQKPAVDLAFLANDVKDTQKVYMLWKALVDDPMPNGPALKQFIIDHPDWPSINLLLKKYETTLNYQTPEEDILAWFNEHPPITLPAITLYAKILLRKGQTTKAVKLIKKTWYETSEYSKDLELFHKEFQDVLKPEDHQIRLDKLLTNEKIDEATKTLEWLNQQLNWFPESQRDLSKMRIDLINNNIKDQCLLEERLQKTKLIFKNDKGLIYEEIKWRRKNKENQKIFDIFQDSSLAGIEKGDPVLFWGERNIMVRRMIEEGNFEKAYAYVNGHQLTEGEHFINAEWLAAFLLMTYLNKPDEGYDRLKKLTDKVKMPISLSRIYYWLGQAALKMNSKDQAFDWFLKASYHIGTYYGQLARCILEDNGKKVPDISLFEEENIPLSIRQNFNKRELVKALTLMSNTQEPANLIETF
jgi:soluble lytic murein transglycosylase